MNNIKVSELMSTKMVTVSEEDSLRKVKDLFEQHHHRHILVTSKGKLKGIVSLTDFLRIMHGSALTPGVDEVRNDELLDSVTIEQLMTQRPVTLKPNDSIKVAAELFELNMFHAIPVVEEEELKGVITTVDLIQYLLKELSN